MGYWPDVGTHPANVFTIKSYLCILNSLMN